MNLRKQLLTLTTAMAACFGLSLTAAHGQSVPPETPGQTYYAAFPVTINVDGDFSEWGGYPQATFADGPQPAADPSDGAVTFVAVADMDNLYLNIQVQDAHIIAGQHGMEYWSEDSVEVYINATGNLALTSYTQGVAQINIPAVNIGVPADRAAIGGQFSDSLGVRAAVVKTETGYAIETAIPLHTGNWNITPANGGVLGFNIQLNGASQLDRDVKLSWSANDKSADVSYMNPSVFGQLSFVQLGEAPVPTQPPPPPAQNPPAGQFSVQGSTILAPDGSPFVAKGVNVNGFNWVWNRRTVDDVGSIVDCWRFNLVRVNSFLFSGEQRWPQFGDNNDLDAIVQAFTSRGVVVVFEAHDRIGQYYSGDALTQLVNWFAGLANRYKGNPYVWFDVMNEPGGRGGIDAASWLNVHQQVIRAIRDTAGANNVIIVEGATGGQDAGQSGGGLVQDSDSAILQYANQITSFDGRTYPNIAFSIHPYDQWNYGDAKMADYFDRVLGSGHAMIVGEYGVDTGQDTTAATQSVFNTAVPRGIGRIVWHWDGSDNNDLTAGTSRGGGWEINDCANPTNLSPLGQWVWNDNHS